MPISKKYSAIFIHIPKCAGTSVESALGMHADLDFIGVKPYLNQVANKETLFGAGLQHMSANEVKAEIDDTFYKEAFKFTIVRNPWERFISHVAWGAGKSGSPKWIEGEPLEKEEVSKAVARITARGSLDNNHLRSQSSYIYDDEGRCLVDFVGRYEQLESDWQVICARLGAKVDLPARMKSVHMHYSNYFSDEEAEQVGQWYKQDIERFGYVY